VGFFHWSERHLMWVEAVTAVEGGVREELAADEWGAMSDVAWQQWVCC